MCGTCGGAANRLGWHLLQTNARKHQVGWAEAQDPCMTLYQLSVNRETHATPEGSGSPTALPLPQQIVLIRSNTHTHIRQGIEHTRASLIDMGRSHPIPSHGLFGLVPPETSARGSSRAATLCSPGRPQPNKS